MAHDALSLKDSLSIIIPVFNEQIHLPRLLENLKSLGVNVCVVDSGSTDRTVEIAEAAGCQVVTGQWGSFSEKLNWALENTPFKTPWVMRVDADEYLTDELIAAIKAHDGWTRDVDGYLVNRRIYFMNRWIRHGGVYPYSVVRIFRREKCRYENRLLDEHLEHTGALGVIKGDICDHPLYPVAQWLRKHINYAETECFIHWNSNGKRRSWTTLRGATKVRRFLKEEVYERMPPLLRAFMYWLYRCVFRLGFLDGFPGVAFHTLHAFWYRFMIDVMIHEVETTKGASVKSRHTV